MSDITKLNVIKLIIDKHKISWNEFANFFNIVNGTERADIFYNLIKELEQDRIILRLPPPIAWQVIDLDKAIIERDKLIAESGNEILLAKKSLKLNKKMFIIAIIAIVVSIILALLKN